MSDITLTPVDKLPPRTRSGKWRSKVLEMRANPTQLFEVGGGIKPESAHAALKNYPGIVVMFRTDIDTGIKSVFAHGGQWVDPDAPAPVAKKAPAKAAPVKKASTKK